MNFDYAFILSTLPAFLKAVGVTLQVGFIAIGTSLLVALINATILVFRTPYLQRLVGLYVELARNTPRLIQLFFTPPRATSRKELSDDTKPESVIVEGGKWQG